LSNHDPIELLPLAGLIWFCLTSVVEWLPGKLAAPVLGGNWT
jgi:hypothetical protein